MLKFLLGAAAAVALLAAAPATACDDCKSCPNHNKAAAADVQKTGAVAEAEKKDQKGCSCDHTASKDCKCGEKCACATCPVHGKKAEEKPKKS